MNSIINIFANAFVRAKGMPFAAAAQEPMTFLPKETLLAEADQILSDYAADFKRMAE